MTTEPTTTETDPLHFDPAEFSHIVVDGPNAEETWTAQQWNDYIDRCKDPKTGGEIIFKVARLIPAADGQLIERMQWAMASNDEDGTLHVPHFDDVLAKLDALRAAEALGLAESGSAS